MRILSTLFFLTLSFTVFSQNAMFIPFGQNESEVKNFFEEREHYTPLRIDKDQNFLQVNTSDQSLKYYFKDEHLYSIEDTRVYKNKKRAEEVIKACISYLEMHKARVRNFASKTGFPHYVIVLDNKILEVKVHPRDKTDKSRTIQIIATSRLYGPRSLTETFANLVLEAY